MSNIRYRSGQTMVLGFDHKKLLQNKINEVCRKIHFDDRGVTWEIFDSFTEYADGRKKKSMDRMFVGIKNDGSDYAATDVKNRIVYVSLMAIGLDGAIKRPFLNMQSLGKPRLRRYEDKLANILIDEITHLQTGSAHNTETYDKQFKANIDLYYGDRLSQINTASPVNKVLESLKKRQGLM